MSIGYALKRVLLNKKPRMTTPSYESWSKKQLIARIRALEGETTPPPTNTTPPIVSSLDPIPSSSTLIVNPDPISQSPKRKEPKVFNFDTFPKRKIALKFCYQGWKYNGLTVQSEPTPLPTVEEVIFEALCKTRLIDRTKGYDGCDWSRCGRTDRGVSAAGQVMALWVRSSIGQEVPNGQVEGDALASVDHGRGSDNLLAGELRYAQLLNKVLPDSIRILAWSPVSPSFSARFNCRYRHYKYFFTSLPPPAKPLNLALLQDAASRLVGEHDFRNFCKLDGSKQISSHSRRVNSAEISLVETSTPIPGLSIGPTYVLDLKGSAFLWHQVRHIMAVLLLVGHGLESPTIVDALLNTDPSNPSSIPDLPLLESKPMYEMADGLPLILWECGFDDQDVKWVLDGGVPPNTAPSHYSRDMLFGTMHASYTRSLTETIVHQHLFQAAATLNPAPGDDRGSAHINLGAGSMRNMKTYVPLVKRPRGDTPEVVNEKWRNGRGLARAAKKTQASQYDAE